MDLKEDFGEDYIDYVHIYRKKGKKFWNANVRDCKQRQRQRQPPTPTCKAKTVLSENEIAHQKITEIVDLRKTESWCLRFTPNSFLVSLTHKETPIFQELASLGYYQADRCQGLTFEEAKLAVTKVAEIHADYITYRNRPNNVPQQRKANREYRVPDASKAIAYAAITAAKIYIPNCEQLLNKVKNNVNKFDSKMKELLKDCWTGDEIRLLNHGDAWLNNFIFKEENGILKETMLLRSQSPRYGSPGLDLNFFLHTSLQVNVLKQKREELLCCYTESLRQFILPDTWYFPPSLDASILKEVRSSEFYSFYTVMCELPLVCLERDQCDNLLLNSFSDKAFVKKISYNFFKCPRVLETLQYTLERLDELGVLDEND